MSKIIKKAARATLACFAMLTLFISCKKEVDTRLPVPGLPPTQTQKRNNCLQGCQSTYAVTLEFFCSGNTKEAQACINRAKKALSECQSACRSNP